MVGEAIRKARLKWFLLASIAAVGSGAPIPTGISAQSQEAATAAPAFVVASVKPAVPHQGGADFRTYPGGRLKITNLTLGEVIREAFHVNRYQVSGGPDWLSTDGFNIEAEAEGNPGREEVMLMLQALLADRFQLRLHREFARGGHTR